MCDIELSLFRRSSAEYGGGGCSSFGKYGGGLGPSVGIKFKFSIPKNIDNFFIFKYLSLNFSRAADYAV